jgi:hypothetical protein
MAGTQGGEASVDADGVKGKDISIEDHLEGLKLMGEEVEELDFSESLRIW